MPVPPTTCPDCALATQPADRYCEGCGADLADPATAQALRWLASAPLADCTLDLDAVAGVTDRGRHRRRNEDALAIGRYPGGTAAVVCDGVSQSARPDQAAVAAARAGIQALLADLASGTPPVAATRAAVLAAATAAAARAQAAEDNPPGCTYTSAVVTTGTVVVGSVGDSPGYWVAEGGARRLTIDDSLAGQLAGAGVPAGDSRYADPRSYALQRWLGADAPGLTPQVTAFSPPGPGVVLVCSDGLSRYLDRDVTSLAPLAGRPAQAARGLLRRALAAGGHDNITVAALAYPPPGRGDLTEGAAP